MPVAWLCLLGLIFMEEYRTIQENTNYAVNDKGQVWSIRRKIVMKHYVAKDGYCRIGLQHNGIKKKLAIHRLVASAFIANRHSYPDVNHIDGNKQNNHVENLEWVTPQMNNDHAIENGLIDTNLRQQDVREIKYLLLKEVNQKLIAKLYNVSSSSISSIKHRKTWVRIKAYSPYSDICI